MPASPTATRMCWISRTSSNEPVSVFDLSGDPNTWVFPASAAGAGGSVPLQCSLQSSAIRAAGTLSGPPGRMDSVTGFLNGTVDSNLQDAAIFLEHRIAVLAAVERAVRPARRSGAVELFRPARGCGLRCSSGTDAAYPKVRPPPGMACTTATSAWCTARPRTISTYLTYNKAQYVLPTANDGAVATWGEDPTEQLRQNTLLEEAGMKFDLFDKRLFISTAGFNQERTSHHRLGQPRIPWPTSRAPRSSSTTSPIRISSPPPATPICTPRSIRRQPSTTFRRSRGINYDGAGISARGESGSCRTRHSRTRACRSTCSTCSRTTSTNPAWGAQANIQVTGPVDDHPIRLSRRARPTSAGFPGLAASPRGIAVTANGGYYKSPEIPWQYTLNAAVFYSFRSTITVKFSIYNLTDQHNLTNDIPFYGNDFMTRAAAAQL